MIDNIVNQLITVGAGLALLGGAYLVWLISGIAKVIFTPDLKWSWKKMFEDLTKTLLICISIMAWVIVFNGLDWFSLKMGADISSLLDGANIAGLVGGIIGGTVYYMLKAYKNFYSFINTDHIDVNLVDPDYNSTANAIKQMFKLDKGDGETIDATLNSPQMGAWPYYYVNVNTPENFEHDVLGVGFDEGYGKQCVAGFKEFMYSLSGKVVATYNGCANGYAYQQSDIEPLGFTWHSGNTGLQNGDWAIFNVGNWGHVAMYFAGKWLGQNQNANDPYIGREFTLADNDINTIIGYYRPNIYVKTFEPDYFDPNTNSVDYIVKSGDTLSEIIIALDMLSDHGLWGEDGDVLYYAKFNSIGDPNLIFPGQLLTFKKR